MVAQSQSPRISLVAHEARPTGLVFVRVPNERGRYLLTHRSVVEVACPHCKAIKGEPCKSHNLYTVGVHCDRKVAWRRLPQWHGRGDGRDLMRADDVRAALSEMA